MGSALLMNARRSRALRWPVCPAPAGFDSPGYGEMSNIRCDKIWLELELTQTWSALVIFPRRGLLEVPPGSFFHFTLASSLGSFGWANAIVAWHPQCTQALCGCSAVLVQNAAVSWGTHNSAFASCEHTRTTQLVWLIQLWFLLDSFNSLPVISVVEITVFGVLR